MSRGPGTQTVEPRPVLLECGHVASRRESMRVDQPEFFCMFCAAWRGKVTKRTSRRCGQQREHEAHRWGHGGFDIEAWCDGR